MVGSVVARLCLLAVYYYKEWKRVSLSWFSHLSSVRECLDFPPPFLFIINKQLGVERGIELSLDYSLLSVV